MSDDFEFAAETEIRYCLARASSILNDDDRSIEDRSTLADTWMRLAEAWSDRASDFFEIEDEEDEIAEQQRLLSEQP